jgi:hypothetical protein
MGAGGILSWTAASSANADAFLMRWCNYRLMCLGGGDIASEKAPTTSQGDIASKALVVYCDWGRTRLRACYSVVPLIQGGPPCAALLNLQLLS